ncbi:glycosyl hydrolase family 61 domain-containing protein [Sarocladium implicatum]|nr:glycosyl hydrolase family 61 domain-containing protein [Sarocladium implicatum]
MKYLATAAALLGMTQAHTLFTTLHIDGKNQGDGTCVRQPGDPSTATSPIYPLNGPEMACGRQGETSVPFVCPAKGGSTLTFELREWPNAMNPGSIDDSHRGPCNVYMKKMNDVLSDKASGDGWFKIWEDGLDTSTGKWCVDTLIENNGLLSVNLPSGLPAGEYLIRPELLALHNAPQGDPQFYHSCAQIFIEEGPDAELEIPKKFEASIPGYISADDPGLTYNIYRSELPEYPIPGPSVFNPTLSSDAKVITKKQEQGVIPSDCLVKNANWCGKPLSTFSDESGCWDTVTECWDQAETCWDSVPPSGYANCEVWQTYCKSVEKQCKGGDFSNGVAKFTGKEVFAGLPGDIPAPYGSFNESIVGGGTGGTKPKDVSEGANNGEVASTTSSTAVSFPTEIEAPEESSKEPVEGNENEDDAQNQSPVEESLLLKVSEDGRCGGSTGQTCKGSNFGDCCSRKGRCGRKTRHCTCGCQPDFGECHE